MAHQRWRSFYMKYEISAFIKNVLENQLLKNRKILIECKKDKNCPTETYENTLDFCSKLEYAIKEMENLK